MPLQGSVTPLGTLRPLTRERIEKHRQQDSLTHAAAPMQDAEDRENPGGVREPYF